MGRLKQRTKLSNNLHQPKISTAKIIILALKNHRTVLIPSNNKMIYLINITKELMTRLTNGHRHINNNNIIVIYSLQRASWSSLEWSENLMQSPKQSHSAVTILTVNASAIGASEPLK